MVIHKKVLKFDVNNRTAYITNVSHDARILSVENQNEVATAWYLNDPQKDQEFKLVVHIVPTGEDVLYGYDRFLNTVLFEGGKYVFHYFTIEDCYR